MLDNPFNSPICSKHLSGANSGSRDIDPSSSDLVTLYTSDL